jgi:hypothetical protein
VNSVEAIERPRPKWADIAGAIRIAERRELCAWCTTSEAAVLSSRRIR